MLILSLHKQETNWWLKRLPQVDELKFQVEVVFSVLFSGQRCKINKLQPHLNCSIGTEQSITKVCL